MIVWGLMVAPFDWDLGGLPRDPVPVDAIPDIGENQQIVFTQWMGRSPQDVEDQITYPLTVVAARHARRQDDPQLLHVRLLDDLHHLQGGRRVLLVALPRAGEAEQPARRAPCPRACSRPSAPTPRPWARSSGTPWRAATRTATRPAAGTSHELRSVQDWYVRYALHRGRRRSRGRFGRRLRPGVPDRRRSRRHAGLRRRRWTRSSRRSSMSNIDVGARTIEINQVEYVIRGLGFIKNLEDIENSGRQGRRQRPDHASRDVAQVTLGPALRRGALDKDGAEAVGGVVVVRYGDNPLAAIKNVKEKIAEISPGLPAERPSPTARVSQVTIVPFYDRTGLIYETLGTLNTALAEEILVTIIVVLVMVMHLRSSLLISGLLPLAVLHVLHRHEAASASTPTSWPCPASPSPSAPSSTWGSSSARTSCKHLERGAAGG